MLGEDLLDPGLVEAGVDGLVLLASRTHLASVNAEVVRYMTPSPRKARIHGSTGR